MKRIFAILLAFLVLLAPAALAEAAGDADAAASGDWYASVEGVPVALSLDPGSGYTLALPAAFGAPKSGAWALDDGFVARLDVDHAGVRVDEHGMTADGVVPGVVGGMGVE